MLRMDERVQGAADGIVITSLHEARQKYVHFDGVISIVNKKSKNALRVEEGRQTQIILEFDDVDHIDNHHKIVTSSDVSDALNFASGFVGKRLLVHCLAGRCRSTAIALAIIAERMGAGREEEAVEALRLLRPTAAPNMLVMDHADRLLDRGGRLKAAWMKLGEKGYRVASVRLLKNSLQVTKRLVA